MCHVNHHLLLMKQSRLRAWMMHRVPALASAQVTIPSRKHSSQMNQKIQTPQRVTTADFPPHYSEDEILATAFGKLSSEKHPNLGTSKAGAAAMAMSFAIAHGLTWIGLGDLDKLVNNIAGVNILPKSKYTFRKITEALFSTTSCSERFYIGSPPSVREGNSRLLSIQPPHCITRLSRRIDDRAHLKASEWKHWLLFYARPCLDYLISQEYWRHLAELSEAVHNLLTKEISARQMDYSERLLSKFATRSKAPSQVLRQRDILKSCVYIKLNNIRNAFLCPMPNMIERD
ncbi:hypothetical protein MRX96_015993 [Rhipicephalus microplus]